MNINTIHKQWTPGFSPTFNLGTAFGEGFKHYADYSEVRTDIPGFLRRLACLHGTLRLTEAELGTIHSTVAKSFRADTSVSVKASPVEYQHRRYPSGLRTPEGRMILVNVTLTSGSNRYDCDRRIVDLSVSVEATAEPVIRTNSIVGWVAKVFRGLFARKVA